jgi:hypothetical protein
LRVADGFAGANSGAFVTSETALSRADLRVAICLTCLVARQGVFELVEADLTTRPCLEREGNWRKALQAKMLLPRR